MDLLTQVRQDTSAEFRKAATTNGGEHKGPCPFSGCTSDDDAFNVWPEHPSGKARYWCRMCGQSGDYLQYLRDRHGMTFQEAKDAAGGAGFTSGNTVKANKSTVTPNVDPPGELWQERAGAFVAYAQDILQSDDGIGALEYLRAERGLHNETIKRFGLGCNPQAVYDGAGRWGADGEKVYLSPGIVIPCEIGGALWYVQVRRPYTQKDGGDDTLSAYLGYVVKWRPDTKYQAVKGGQGKALFGADDLRGDRPLLVCEGKFDAMLAWQEIGDLVDVVTLGGAGKGSGGLPGRWLLRLLPYELILVAYDADRAGESGAAELVKKSKRARRVKVPQGDDLTSFWQAGGDLGAWVAFQMAILNV